MILSNIEIINCLNNKRFDITPLENNKDPSKTPFNTSSIDIRLGNTILEPIEDQPIQINLS